MSQQSPPEKKKETPEVKKAAEEAFINIFDLQ